jgi:hypothetical protein
MPRANLASSRVARVNVLNIIDLINNGGVITDCYVVQYVLTKLVFRWVQSKSPLMRMNSIDAREPM